MIVRLTDQNGRTVSENCELFTEPKFFAFAPPAIRWEAAQDGDDCVVRLTCDAFAWGVWLDTEAIDVRFDDNAFFLLPGETRTVGARHERLAELDANLTVTSVAELGR